MARPPAIPRDVLAAEVRRLLFGGRSGALSTTFRGREPWPYGSLVTYAPDVDGRPIFLFSKLSDHTGNLAAEPRASLLVEQASRLRNPQRGPRVSLLGTVRPSKDPRHRARFLARHPDASLYAGFGDFGFYVMTVDRVHLVGGFARAQWLKAAEVLPPRDAAKAVAAAEEGILAHMNADHGEALDLYANRLLHRKGTGWRAVGCDPWGLDLARGGHCARLPFPEMATDANDVRKRLVAFAAAARA